MKEFINSIQIQTVLSFSSVSRFPITDLQNTASPILHMEIQGIYQVIGGSGAHKIYHIM